MQFTWVTFGENNLIFKFFLFLSFLFREILPCLKHVVKKEYSSLMMVALMRKISGRKSTLHLHQNPKDDPGERICYGDSSVQPIKQRWSLGDIDCILCKRVCWTQRRCLCHNQNVLVGWCELVPGLLPTLWHVCAQVRAIYLKVLRHCSTQPLWNGQQWLRQVVYNRSHIYGFPSINYSSYRVRCCFL